MRQLIPFLILILLISVAACMTPKRAVNYLKKKDLLADTCAVNFPVKDSIVVRDSIQVDTAYLSVPHEDYVDFLPEGDNGSRQAEKGCVMVVTKTIRRDSLIYRRDVSQETVLQKSIDDLKKTVAERDTVIAVKEKSIREKDSKICGLQKRIVSFYALILLLVVFIVRKPVSGFLSGVINPVKRFFSF